MTKKEKAIRKGKTIAMKKLELAVMLAVAVSACATYPGFAQSGCPGPGIAVSPATPDYCSGVIGVSADVCCDNEGDYVWAWSDRGYGTSLGAPTGSPCMTWSGYMQTAEGVNLIQAESAELDIWLQESCPSEPVPVNSDGDGPKLSSISAAARFCTGPWGAYFVYTFICAPGSSSGWYWQETVINSDNNCGSGTVGADGTRQPAPMFGTAPVVQVNSDTVASAKDPSTMPNPCDAHSSVSVTIGPSQAAVSQYGPFGFTHTRHNGGSSFTVTVSSGSLNDSASCP